MVSIAKRKSALVEALTRSLGELSPESDQEIAEAFGRHCFQDVAIDDLERQGPEALLGVALSLLDLLGCRPRGKAELRIFNPAESGETWAEGRTVIEVLSDDMPFLVDSITAELSRRELTIHLAVHPQVAPRRDDDGKLSELVALGADDEGVVQESLMHYQVDQLTSQAARVELETALRKVLTDVTSAVADWRPMCEACLRAIEVLETEPPPVEAEELAETIEFLRWVAGDHFTFLGYLEYDLTSEGDDEYLSPNRDTGLGLWRKLPLHEQAHALQPLPSDERRFLHGGSLVLISKTSQHSTVHRNVHMDVISLKRFTSDGEVAGEARFFGLFTSMAYSIAARNIPLVRRKVEGVVRRTQFLPASHNVKVLRHIVEHYPRDELFQVSEADLFEFATRILQLQLRPRLALLVRRDEEERFVSCMVYVPRDRHSTEVRRLIQHELEQAFEGKVTAYYTRLSDRPLAQLQFIVETRPGNLPDYDVQAIEARLTEAVKSWPERLKDALGASAGEEAGLAIWRRYGEAFDYGYQQYTSPHHARKDIPEVDAVLETGALGIRLYRRPGDPEDRFHLRTFERGAQKPLSQLLPMLENMGLEVVSEHPFQVLPRNAEGPVWIRDFEVITGVQVDLGEAEERFSDALTQVYRGDVEDDGFNRLVVGAGLEWRQVVLLRAYCKYLRQAGTAFSQAYMETTLARNPKVARRLIDLFYALFDPSAQGGVDRHQLLLGEIHQQLDQVAILDEDRILRRFLNLVQSTLRTNVFQTDADGSPKPYVSLKLDGHSVLDLPSPRPQFEVFVYSPRVEAVHLRGGKVARGGIRWSDRLEDFRTEILGLVKSQMVKNAVIVPVGAKGGFVVKRPPAGGDREALLAEGQACYQTMIRGLLDLTDNLRGSKVVPAPDVVRRDDDDTYLVVAADKGTATFSDLANGVAAEYGFWLGDAFASGGSVGYDHKKMGITARGAWESVKRHFRELGRDIQKEPFTCVGVGDMSGDVFGNGMLLSPHTRLVAAFNHLHVFVDPDPPAEAYDERRRLFELPRSTWADYDRALLSEGGEIFDRSAKQVTIGPRIRKAFGFDTDTLTPNELIQGLLRSEVELLWFGGIGTYIRAEGESHADVGDRTNDEVRVSASEVRCKVVGEGANLGMTQRARIELGRGGVRLNTDFIDNSGGVDCSDHEVNIKIALRDAVASGSLEAEERVPLLASMTDEVAELVLRDNYLQAQAISLVEAQGVSRLHEQVQLMRHLERRAGLDRRLEFLPDDATLAERRKAKQGLTRPEIAVLQAYAKIDVYNELLDSDLPDDALLASDLIRYFPGPVGNRFRREIEGHRLRREIIATHVTNSIVNRVGPTFISRLAEETGRRAGDVARAYTAARDIFDLRSLWDEIEALDNQVASSLQNEMMLASVTLIGEVTRWLLRHGGRPFDVDGVLERYETGTVVVAAQLVDLLPKAAKGIVRKRFRKLREAGAPRDLATRIAGMEILPSACDVARCARDSGVAVERVGKVYFAVGERFGFDRLRLAAEHIGGEGPYQKGATTATLDDLSIHQSELTRQVVRYPGRARKAIGSWVASRPEEVERLERLLEDFDTSAHIDLAMLSIAERELRRLVEPR
ncbi:MAG: NAD-glutamate dehydrogenase [Acidobacteriota bacterium]